MSHGSAAVVDRQLEGLSHRRSQICFRNSAWDCRGHDEAAIQGVETTVTIGNESETQETSVATSPASADTRSTIRTSRSDIPSMDSPDQAIVYTIDRGPRGQVVVVGDGSALARAAAERFARAVEEAVAARGQVFVALSGGSTPKQMGTILTREPYRSRIPWDRVQVFWGDERWVPLGSPESNAGEARRGFLDLVPIPPTSVHPWDTEAETPEAAAAAYERLLRDVFNEPTAIPRFDLVLLGMGDDGHTASLFPQTRALAERGDRLAVANFVPKLDAARLTLTAPVLNAGREILFLVGGPGKADTIESVLDGPEMPTSLPAQMIRPAHQDSTLRWLVDEDAAAKLSR
jgi:6-phosphogluconolactonase